jgi:hypothetical protein
MIGMILGSIAGGYIPVMFGVDLFSFTSIIGNAIGGLIGIWIAYKLTQGF